MVLEAMMSRFLTREEWEQMVHILSMHTNIGSVDKLSSSHMANVRLT